MNPRLLTLGPSEAAMYIDAPLATARARVTMLGKQLHVVDDAEHGIAYQVGSARFPTLEAVEDWLDEVAE